MASKFEEDDDTESEFIDPETGQEVLLDAEVWDETEGFLSKERSKAGDLSDKFSSLRISDLDKNSKRRAQRLVKRMVGIDGVKSKYIDPETINGYDFYKLALPPYNLDYLSDLSVENATHAACISVKTTSIVGSGYKWLETNKVKQARMNVTSDDQMQKLSKKLQRVTDNLDDWLESLNQDETFTETLVKVWNDYEATGNGYIEVGRNRGGQIAYIGHIPSRSVRVRVDRDGFLQMVFGGMGSYRVVFFRNFGDKKTTDPFGIDPTPNEIIHLKKHSPKNNYYGIPDIISALTAVAGEKFASEYNLDYFENKAVPRYALIIKGAKLTAQAERRILDYFRREVKGKHHGTLYIPVPAPMGTNVDVKLEAIENKIQEGSFVKYRQENRVEIAIAHRVPLTKISVEGLGGGTAGPRESDKNFKLLTIKPGQSFMRTKVNLIVSEQTDMFRFGFEEYDLVDEETRSRIDDRRVRNGTKTANEIRGDYGEAPIRGGDERVDLAAQSKATVDLQEAQAKAAPIVAAAKAQPFGDSGATQQKGPARQTLDGGKNTPGSTKTPASQTAAGTKSPGQSIEQHGPRARDR